MGRECKYHAHFTPRAARDIDWLSNKPWLINNKKNLTKYTGMDTEFELQWQKSKDKYWQGCFEIDSMFRTSVHCFFSNRNELKGNKNYFKLAGGSTYWGLELAWGSSYQGFELAWGLS